VLGAAYRGGVRATAFSGVFGTVRALAASGAVPLVHDPLYTGPELAGLGLEPYRLGEVCDAAIVQTDHAAYAGLTPDDLPGVKAIVDGRAITDPALWEGVPHQVLGIGAGSARAGSARAGSARAGSARAGSARAGSARAGSARAGSARTSGHASQHQVALSVAGHDRAGSDHRE
jgi:hypothetical protein